MVWSEENLCPIGVVIWLGSGGARCNSQEWLSQGVATVHARDGGGIDRACVEFERGADVPCATVAATADGLSNGTQ
jgi:hypothetical protein